jgi:hypothetical protein
MHETVYDIRSNVNQSDVPSCKHATKSDRSTLDIRSWWSKYGLRHAHMFGAAAPENLVRLPRREQIDPWIIHTKSCSKCRTVVERARWFQKLGLVVAACGGLSFQVGRGRIRMVVTSAAIFGGMLVNTICRKIVGELAGTPYHYEIQDRSLSHSD